MGGIAGYSKAMLKFRVNKTVDQVMQIATNVRTFFGSQSDYSALSDTVLHKAHLVPAEMVKSKADGATTTISFEDAFGGKVTIAADGKVVTGDNRAFVLKFEGVPEEACLELAVLDWGASSGSGLIALGVNQDPKDNDFVNSISGGDGIASPYNNTIPMSPAKAVTACSTGDANELYWKFF